MKIVKKEQFLLYKTHKRLKFKKYNNNKKTLNNNS